MMLTQIVSRRVILSSRRTTRHVDRGSRRDTGSARVARARTPLCPIGCRRRAGPLRWRPLALHVQLSDPAFRAPGDEDPEQACETRAAWLDRAASEALTLATAHVPPSPIGRIAREDGGLHVHPR